MKKQNRPLAKSGGSALTVSQQVASAVAATKFGYASWCDRLPEPLRKEFEQARDDWDRSRWRQAAYARAIIEVAKARGVTPLPTQDTVCRWLRNRKA